MFVAYIDESDHGDSYWVYSLLIKDSEIIKLQNSLNRIASGLPMNYGIDSDSEFHSYDILNGKGDWKVIENDYKSQMSIFEELVDTILIHEIRFIAKGIRRSRFVPNYGDKKSDIHHAALTWNLEKVQFNVAKDSEIALVISDETSEQDYHQRNISRYKIQGTFGWDVVALTNIVDTIYFAPSKSSRLLQAIDILAYTHKIGNTPHSSPQAQDFYDRMWDKVSRSGKIAYLKVWG